jgi:hypothetical protein
MEHPQHSLLQNGVMADQAWYNNQESFYGMQNTFLHTGGTVTLWSTIVDHVGSQHNLFLTNIQ